MTAGAAISRSVLSDQVRDRLLAAILDGRYEPGARIVETRVARELGTSQAPVREALRDLEALGLVEMEAFRGARVRRPSSAELLEAFSVRSVLEGLAASLAAERVADADVAELRELVGAMQRAAADGDPAAEASADGRFHERLVELSGNGTLERLWRMLEPSSRTFVAFAGAGADHRRVADLHVPIVDALARRDPAAVRAAIDRHGRDVARLLPPPSASPDTPVHETGSPAVPQGRPELPAPVTPERTR